MTQQADAALRSADRVALDDLVMRYASYVDLRKLSHVANLFTADGVLLLPAPPDHLEPVHRYQGREDITRAMSGLTQVPVTFHALVGQTYEQGPTDQSASGRVSCVAHHLSERASGEVIDLAWHVHYDDTYLFDESAWRLAVRAVHIEWIETSPVRRWARALDEEE